jgi:hypothetical protein
MTIRLSMVVLDLAVYSLTYMSSTPEICAPCASQGEPYLPLYIRIWSPANHLSQSLRWTTSV